MGQATLPAFYSGPWTTLPTGWTKSGLGTDYASSYDGAGGTAAKFDSSGDWIRIQYGAAAATVSYYIRGNSLSGAYTFKVQESANGSTWTDVATYDTANPISSSITAVTNFLLPSSRNVQFIYVTKAVGNVGLDGVAIAGPGVPSVSFNPNGTASAPVSNAFSMAVSIMPSGSGVQSWNMTPAYAGPANLSGGNFTFTPDSADDGKTFTLSVVATNSVGATTGTASIAVTPYAAPVPVISFSPAAPYSIMATHTQKLGIGVTPTGTEILSWDLQPGNYAGSATLVGTNFTFIPAEADGPANYTLTVVATNVFGWAMGTADIAVSAFVPPPPPGAYICSFEDGSKAGYASADVSLSNKVWNLTGILIGTLSSDLKIGNKAARLKYDPYDGDETMTIQSPVMSNGVGNISLWYGPYGTMGYDAPVLAIEISESLTSGWIEVGEVDAGAVTALTYYSAEVNVSWPVYVRIRAKFGSYNGIANFDNITITPYRAELPPDVTFSPAAPYSIMATDTQQLGIRVTPAGGGIQSWMLLPSNYSGSATLAGTNFSFTPGQTDGPGNYTLSIVATNGFGSTTGTAAIAVLARYAIAIAQPTNGTAATVPADATTAGSTVTITTTPDAGYVLGYIDVVDSDLNPVAVTGNAFTMPNSSVTVSVMFVPAHAIAIATTTNGTIATTPSAAAGEGTTVSVAATPNVGYMVESFAVVDASSNPVAVTGNAFTMPNSSVTVSAIFRLIPMQVYTNAMRYEDFKAWSDPSFGLIGNHTRSGWSVQNASIEPNAGVLNTRAALLGQSNSAIVAPAFAEGVGRISFWARAANLGAPAGLLLQTSIDGGSNWIDHMSFMVTTGMTHSAWLYVTNSTALARLIFDPESDSGDVSIDNIEIALPVLSRKLDFDDFSLSSSYKTYAKEGWNITDAAIVTNLVYSRNSARIRNGGIVGPYMDTIGLVSFYYALSEFSGDDTARITVAISPDGSDWTTLNSGIVPSAAPRLYSYFNTNSAYHYVRILQTTVGKRIHIDEIGMGLFQPRPTVSVTSGFDPLEPIADMSFRLIAYAEPLCGASILSVTGYCRIGFGEPVPIVMAPVAQGSYVSVSNIPGLSVGSEVRCWAQVQYAGVGAASDSTGYTTNLVSSAVITNLVVTQTFSAITVQGSFIATNDPPPNMMRMENTALWESDHHITNSGPVALRFSANMDGRSWGATNGAPTLALPAAGILEAGSTNCASVALENPGRFRITFNHLTGNFTFSRLYSDDSQGSPPNLIKNPGFELTTSPDGGDAEDWIASQSWPKSVADGYAPHSGNWCGAIHGQWFPGWANSASIAQDVAVVEGRAYQVSAWLNATPDWTADSMQIKIEWMDSAGTAAGAGEAVEIPPLSGSWVKRAAECVAPANAAKARIVFLCTGVGTAGTMHVDDIEMKAMGPTSYYASASGAAGVNLRLALRDIISVARANSYDSLQEHFIHSDARPDGTVWDMYSDNPNGRPPYVYRFNACERAGTFRIEGDKYCREHSWPRSWFNSLSPMYEDIFHVYPADGEASGNHLNFPFGEVTWPEVVSLNGSKTGPCSTPGYSGIVFEPLDQYKGDFARTYFYMSTRYFGQDHEWTANAAVTGAELNPWILEMLLRWHENDPVSMKELVRNEAAYAAQSNRNPFIDYPEWAHAIWGYATNRDLPRIVIREPEALLFSVSAGDAFSIQGQVSSQVVGRLIWYNSTTLQSGSLVLIGTNFLLSDVQLAYGQNQVNLIVSNSLGQTAGRSLVVFRRTDARETFDNDASWIGSVCDPNSGNEYTALRYVPTNRLNSAEEFQGSKVAIKRSITMDAHGYSWGMDRNVSDAIFRYQTPSVVTNFSVYLAPYYQPISFEVRVSTNSGLSYETLLSTNETWFDAARQYKKFESPPMYAKPQLGMLAYIEIRKTSGDMLFIDDFDFSAVPNPDDLDTDALPDAWEIEFFANITTIDGSGDYDGDNLSDIDEYRHGTSPLLQDTDGDGQSDWAESIAGTAGTNDQDFFAIKEIGSTSEATGPFVLYWDSVTGRTYRLFIGGSVLGGWSNVLQVTGDGHQKNYTNESSDPVGFFRLTVEKP